MGARGRLNPFWTRIAVRLAATEVHKIKSELNLVSVVQTAPISPEFLADAAEQFAEVLKNDLS